MLSARPPLTVSAMPLSTCSDGMWWKEVHAGASASGWLGRQMQAATILSWLRVAQAVQG